MSADERMVSLSNTIKTGEKAAQVLENSEFNRNFDIIMEGIKKDLMQVDTSDEKKMISVVTEYQVAAKFKARLVALMEDGRRSKTMLSKLIDKIR